MPKFGFVQGPKFIARLIASRAAAQFVIQMPPCPPFTITAASNAASGLVFEDYGLTIVERFVGEETDRYVACEEVTRLLKQAATCPATSAT